MTLADYLATEQAREDVRESLNGDNHYLPIMGSDDLCLVRDEVEAWHTMMLWDDDQNKELTAYFRPDGDRYIVTDLGEGVRALRLRTGKRAYGPATGAAMLEKLTLCNIEDSQGNVGALGGLARELELVDVKPADLPDAICRVMLASLRVAGVGR